ncbi:MAG TPA: gamma-glutamylcyclotransferase family protein [Vicinamibacterales bacterium]|nr:gamma-glutamylcyclotransferase family protein [Vicinamibacterales bacterium]
MSSAQRVDVFFYGILMDQELLSAQGVLPLDGRHAVVRDVALRIGQRAALAPAPGQQVHGVVFSLTLADVSRLYDVPSLRAYQPSAVLAELVSGNVVPALCYNLPVPPRPEDRNPEYAAKLKAVAERIGLPKEYVESL